MRSALLLALAVLLAGCSLIGRSTGQSAAGCAEADPGIALLCEAIDLVQEGFVDPVSDPQLVEAGVAGVEALGTTGASGDLECDIDDEVAEPICEAIDLADVDPETGTEAALASIALSLDANSAYLDPQSLEMVQEETRGEVEGIGALVGAEDGAAEGSEGACAVVTDTCRLVVVSTFPSGPAREAGILPGDAIVEVDGRPVTGFHFDEVTALVRGRAGTDVTLTILRDGSVEEIRITRAAVEIPVVQSEVFGNTGYLRLNIFTSNADAQLRGELETLLAGGVEEMVLDLRDNPGGTLQSAIEVTSEFLAEGTVVVTESPDETQHYAVTGEGIATDPDLGLVVVINRGSASASEVVAGVLGESGRGTVVGENSFGKNTVQQRFPLSNGGALKITVARWLTPEGGDFGEGGITPDVEIDLPFDLEPEEVVTRVEAALER